MARVRVRLDFTIDAPGHSIPGGLDRVYDLIQGALEAAGVISDTRAVDLLPGARVKLSVVRVPKAKAAG